MDDDSFPRRTATPAALAPWVFELARTVRGLVEAYVPGGTLEPRVREELLLAVTEVTGCRVCAWAHGSWAAFLGTVEGESAPEAARRYAQASAQLGRPDDPKNLVEELGGHLAMAVRATVAHGSLVNLLGNTVDGLIARATGKRPAQPARAALELATVVAAMPPVLALIGAAALLRSVTELAPPPLGVTVNDNGESNLLVHVLSEALAPLDANAACRLAIARSPFVIVIGIRAGRTSATVRVGRGEVALENGLASDAWLIVEGDVGPLLRLAARPVVRDLAHIRVRPA
ncbi:MAG TPA: hypothetical protein VNB24_06000 [Acidimicrobiales bacterium]|nr:hypothetical protein [Acidimicrobiales bacterium]